MKKYKVTGKYEEKKIDKVVNANSKKQAKLKAGFMTGCGGNKMKGFLKSRNIKVRMVK